MIHKKENIVLDAVIVNVIGHAAFNAELQNGHRFVAYGLGEVARRPENFRIGETIRVEMSPFDMSKGKILLQNSGIKDES